MGTCLCGWMSRRAGRWSKLAKKPIQDAAAGARDGWKVQGVLGDLVLDRCGREIGRAMKVLSYVAAWGLFYEANGRGPNTVREFSAAVKVPRNTANRWDHAFRETFPDLESPALLWAQVKAGVRSDSVEVVALEVGASQVKIA